MTSQPQPLTHAVIKGVLEQSSSQQIEGIRLNNLMGILNGYPGLFRAFMKVGSPFSISDHRFILVQKGEIHAVVNLIERTFTVGTLVYIGPGSIIQLTRISPDFRVCGFALFEAFPLPFDSETLPPMFNGQLREVFLSPNDSERTFFRTIFEALWQLMQQPDPHAPTLAMLVGSLMTFFDTLHSAASASNNGCSNNAQTIFSRYIQLVNKFGPQEHHLPFYARKMCLTEHYLSTIVHQSSGVTAKKWIDRSLVSAIQVELRHSAKSLQQIADEMNFPNASFFSKYFKRLTGFTPSAYRDKK